MKSKHLSDHDILTELDRDQQHGFRQLVRRYQEQLYWHIRRMVVTHADAEDVLQETFVRVFRGLHGFKRDSSLKTWLLRIATNEALRHLERNSGAGEHVQLDSDDNVVQLTADEHFDYSDLEAVKLQQAIHSLPPKQQVTFNLRYYDELGYDDIARITDSTAATAKVNYHIAKQKIIQHLKEH